mgnify:CR=1 FL=1
MDKIKIAITGRVASVVALPEVVADNAEYEVDFALDPREGWDTALPITALFVRRDGSYTPRIMDAGKTSCTMPPQTGTNIVYVGLTQDDMRTTTPATIKVHRSIRTVAHDPLPAPSEDVYAQILAAYAGTKTISGKGAPTSATQGEVNQLYRDEDTQRLYICTATDGGYTWAAVSGGSVDVDATLTKAGYAADAKAAGDAIGKKIDKAQGVENAGKVLGVDEEGNVAPQNKPVQALAGSAAPTAATAGVVGQEYYVIVDNAVTEMYVCTSALIGSYTWDKVEFGSSGITKTFTFANNNDFDINDYYMNVQYTQENIASDGTTASGTAQTTEYLPVISGETLLLNNSLTTKVAFYDANKTFISITTTTASQTEYTVPENAAFARFQNVYNGGAVRFFMCRDKPIREITNLRELVLSPLKSTVNIGITGDSNTYGYNLTNREDEGWAFLFTKMLSTITNVSVDYTSPYAYAWGYFHYSGTSNFKNGSRFAIYTDAQSVTLSQGENYSSVWKWYIDDVEQTETGATISGLSNSLKKVEVRFTSGQAVNPKLTIAKAITATNSAVVGANVSHVTIPDNKDWLIIMIGTNNRGLGSGGIYDKFLQYAGKATYIVPFPNKKTDASYTISQAQLYSELANAFRGINYETCDCSPFAFAFTMNDDFYQSDKIHFNAAGHKAIANIVSGQLGLPICAV